MLKRDPKEVEEKARQYLAKVGIGDKADAWPAQLSGGQQQRAAIARALCMEPRALLFDEPTGALDPELEQEVVRVIKALADEGRTMLLVTHDMKLAADCSDHVIFLHMGKIEEAGPASQPVRQSAKRTAARLSVGDGGLSGLVSARRGCDGGAGPRRGRAGGHRHRRALSGLYLRRRRGHVTGFERDLMDRSLPTRAVLDCRWSDVQPSTS